MEVRIAKSLLLLVAVMGIRLLEGERRSLLLDGGWMVSVLAVLHGRCRWLIISLEMGGIRILNNLGLFDEIGLSQNDFSVVDRSFGTARHSGKLFTTD